MFIQPKSVCTILYCFSKKYPKGPNEIILINAGKYIIPYNIRLFNRLSVFARTKIKWSKILLKIPQPKTEKDLQKALSSAVAAEFEMECENDQIAKEIVRSRNNLFTLLFAFLAIVHAPKTIYTQPQT